MYDDNVMAFAKKIIPDPVILRLMSESLALDNIKQFYVRCQNEEDKFKALAKIYETITVGQAMVFCHVSLTMNYPRFIAAVFCSVGTLCKMSIDFAMYRDYYSIDLMALCSR